MASITEVHMKAYRSMISSRTGLRFLFSERMSSALKDKTHTASVLFGVSERQALQEIRRFIAIMVYTDYQGATISPTPLMEHIWRAATLDLNFYDELCTALGTDIVFELEESMDEEECATRLRTLGDIYEGWFDERPIMSSGSTPTNEPNQDSPTSSNEQTSLQRFDDCNSFNAFDQARQARSLIASIYDRQVINFNIKSPNGQLIYFVCRLGRPVRAVIRGLCEHLNIAKETVQLSWNGRRLFPEKRLGDCGLASGDSLDVRIVAGGQ